MSWFPKGPADVLPDDPSYNLKGHLAYVQELHTKHPYNTQEKAAERLFPFVTRTPEYLREEMLLCTYHLLKDNDVIFPNFPTIEYRLSLTRLQKRYTIDPEPAFSAVEEFTSIFAGLPREKGIASIPFQDFVSPVEFISFVYRCFYNVQSSGEHLFSRLRDQLHDNLLTASGYSPESYTKGKIIKPEESNDPPREIYRKYLKDTPFLRLLDEPVPFRIPLDTYASHGIILAPPRHGKSQLLGTLIHGFLHEPNPPGVIVIDPHGDLFNTTRTRVDPKRLIILDPDTDPPALNFLDFGTSNEAEVMQTFSYLMSSLSGGMTEKQGAIIPYLLKLLRKIPNASLETLRQVVDEKVKKPEQSQFADAIASLPVVDQGFFQNQFYSGRMQETKDAIGWKLYAALSSNAFREMFSATHNNFSADQALRESKVVLINGARDSLGNEGRSVFLQFMVAQFFSAALRRNKIPIKDRHLSVLVIDEAHHVFNSQTANILTEARKYGLGFLGATQVVQQIPEDVKAAIYGATAIKIAGPVSHNDAMLLAREMYTTGDFIRSMKATPGSHAEWACHVSNLTGAAVKLTLPYGALEKMPEHPQPATTRRKVERAEPETTPQNITEPTRTSTTSPDFDTDH